MIEKFIHQHNTEIDYEEYSVTKYKEPYVSYTLESDLVRYNLTKNKSFTLNIINGGQIIIKSSSNSYTKSIQYSLDNITWNTITPTTSGVVINVNTMDKLYIKSNSESLSDGINYISINNSEECTFKISGNILSLLYGDSYLDVEEVTSQYAFKNLFLNATGLISIDNDNIVLPQNLTVGMYEGTFKNCINLTNTFELITDFIPDYAYKETFSGCSSLTFINPNRLYINDIGAHSCEEMFKGCSSLSNVNIILNDCAEFCCKGMFKNCTSITTTKLSELNSETIYESCYEEMYYGCNNLITVYDELIPSTLAVNCYKGMFAYTKIKKSPNLYAKNLVNGCYEEMFYNCAKLNSVSAKFLNEFNEIYTKNWLIGVAERGSFYRSDIYEYEVITNTSGINYGIPVTWEIEMYSKEELSKMYLTFEIQTAGDIQFYRNNYGGSNRTIYYSINNGSWISLSTPSSGTGPSFHVEVGDSVRFKSTNTAFTNRSDYYSGLRALNGLKFRAFGNIASLFLGDDFISNYNTSSFNATGVFANNTGITSVKLLYLPNNRIYRGLFYSCTALKDFPIIEDITTVPSEGFYETFYNCTSIDIEIPDFSNFTSVNSYSFRSMFNGCTNILIPEDFSLPFDSIPQYCCYQMFFNCKKVNFSNNFTISARSIGMYGCYRMFYGCTSLDLPEGFVLAPEQLAANCYQEMFYGCTKLTNAPILPAQDLSNCSYCYGGMFYGCTSLENPPILSARQIATYCYYQMFENCSNLVLPESFILPAQELASSCYREMFDNCTKLVLPESFILPAQELASACYRSMFYKCSSITTINSNLLPSEQLAAECYYSMFYECKNLILPENFILPAQELASACYRNMFYGCSSITSINSNLLPAQQLATECYYSMFYNCYVLALPNSFILPAIDLTGCNNCYYSMFYGCSSITTINSNLLPARQLASSCYYEMFYGCRNLVLPNSFILPAIDLTGCSSCYYGMFYNCSSITTINSNLLPARQLASSCYNLMFYGCTNLILPESFILPAIDLTGCNSCYTSMFYNCTSITRVNTNLLPATTLCYECYRFMFYGCINLENAPELLFEGTLDTNSYGEMFYNCHKINYVKSLASNIGTNTNNWLYGVAESGTLIHHSQANYEKNNPSGIPVGWNEELYGIGISDEKIIFESQSDIKVLTITSKNNWNIINISSGIVLSTSSGIGGVTDVSISLNNLNNFENSITVTDGVTAKTVFIFYINESSYMADPFRINVFSDGVITPYYYKYQNDVNTFYLSYKINNGEWIEKEMVSGNSSTRSFDIDVVAGDVVYFKANNGFIRISSYQYGNFYFSTINCDFTISGNIKSLFTENYLTDNISLNNYDFYYFMYNKTKLYSAKYLYLPFTELSTYCYYGMFCNCSNLEYAPNIPQITNAGDRCFCQMFDCCNSLKEFGNLIVSTQQGTYTFYQMFCECNSLKSFGELNISSIPSYSCYRMFYNCKKLSQFNNIILGDTSSIGTYCYDEMFCNCAELTLPSTFRLPSLSLASYCYYNMFKNCSILELPLGFRLPAGETEGSVLADYCYTGMFENCKRLTIPNGFTLNAMSLYIHCYQNMFNGCSSLILPEGFTLPAETYKPYCYSNMFKNCISLVKAPIINMLDCGGNSTYQYALEYMFSNCSNLNFIKCLIKNPPTYSSSYYSTYNWVSGVAASGIFITNKNMTNKWVLDSTYGIPTGWTALNDLIQIDESQLLFDNDSAEYTLNIKSVIDFNINTDSTWIHLSTNTNSPDSIDTKLIITIDANTGDGRNGNITISGDGCTITLPIVQHELEDEPLRFEIISDGTIFWYHYDANTQKTIEYSKNGGEWKSITSSTNYSYTSSSYTNFISVKAGDFINFRGNNTTYGVNNNDNRHTRFRSTAKFRVLGNLLSLIDPTNFNSITTFSGVATFRKLFYECVNLIDISGLRITAQVLVDSCYRQLFQGCTGITYIPSSLLSTTTLANYCYAYMFDECTGLTGFPKQMISTFTTLKNNCYTGMFYGCTNITSIPSDLLPASTLTSGCYQEMFGETGLIEIPSTLFSNVTTLAGWCYYKMFYKTKITSIPSNLLSVVNVQGNCYAYMFAECKLLESIPATLLPSTKTANNCYESMFDGCSSITSIPNTLFSNITANYSTNCFKYMFRGTGITSIYEDLFPNKNLNTGSLYGMFENCTELESLPPNLLKWTGTAPQQVYMELFKGCEKITTIPDNFIKYTGVAPNCYKQMFMNCKNLVNVPDNLLSATSLAANCYQEMFKNCEKLTKTIVFSPVTLANYCYSSMYEGCTGLTTIQGSLINTSINTADYCFYYMFYKCTSLVNLPDNFNLTGASVAIYSYCGMFDRCENLVTAPILVLSSTATRCCEAMFYGCKKMILPEGFALNATILAERCYGQMFEGCESLTLPSSFIINNLESAGTQCCWYMFTNCKSLVNINNINLTVHGTLGSSCYMYMFDGCSNLTSIPENLLQCGTIDGDTLSDSCYMYMFRNCISLTSIPKNLLPCGKNGIGVLNSQCYSYMFYECTGLTSLPSGLLPATTLARYCYSDMFYGCTGLTVLPSDLFPSTITLADYCCQYMFYNCINLVNAPDLLTENLSDSCYYYMFYNCKKLKYIKCLAITIASLSCYNWVNVVSNDGIFIKNLNATDWPTGNSGIPANWTVYNDGTEPNDILLYGIAPYKEYYLDNEINTRILNINSNKELTFVLTNNWNTLNTSYEVKDNIYLYNLTINTPVNNSNEAKESYINIYQGGNIIDNIYIYQTNLTKNYILNLNNNSWLEDQSISGYKTNTMILGESKTMYINIIGYEEFTINVYSGYSGGEYAYYNYLYVGNLDSTNPTSNYIWNGYGASSNKWTTLKFNNITTDTVHTITIVYVRNSSSSTTENKHPDNYYYAYLRIPTQ